MTPDAQALCVQLRAGIVRTGWSEMARRTGLDRCALHRSFPEIRGNRSMNLMTAALVANALGLRLSLTRGDPGT